MEIIKLLEERALRHPGKQEEDLRCFCRQHIAHFKIPHYFEFRDALPKNRIGKADKEVLRKSSGK